jgi:nucleoid-associated protein YgaU
MATTIDPLLFSGSDRTEAAARPRPSVRTFQRRRRTLGAIVIFGLASGLISTGAFASDPSPANQVIPRSVVAQSGDTLWDIARTIVPTGNISELVYELVRANGSHIEAGQVIRIP